MIANWKDLFEFFEVITNYLKMGIHHIYHLQEVEAVLFSLDLLKQ
ncbi:MAG: hypothetical protein ACJARX_000607 [Psychroserpens sp.]|jgi:hypothetical protein